MLTEIKNNIMHYFVDENGRWQGEFKSWHQNGQMWEYAFIVDDSRHGEYKQWDKNGILYIHCFYINGTWKQFDELPKLQTPEDRMYFTLKYNLPLLPVETTC